MVISFSPNKKCCEKKQTKQKTYPTVISLPQETVACIAYLLKSLKAKQNAVMDVNYFPLNFFGQW